MLAHRRWRRAELGGQLAGAVRSLGEQIDGTAAHRVGQRCQQVVEWERGYAQLLATIGWPSASSASALLTSRTFIEKVQR